MKKRIRKIISGTMAACLLLSITGCSTTESVNTDTVNGQTSAGDGSNTTEEVTPAWKTLAENTDKVSFDWYINYSWFNTAWGGNVVSDKITEETGVDINFITPMGNEQEKLNALISSDSLPDLITLGYWESAIDDMINQGKVYALNELADEYDPYFYQVTDQTAVNWYTQEDGNIYGYPNSSVTPQDMDGEIPIGSNITFLVRKDIYEAIGSPDMTTQEGFAAAVKKAKEMFPEVNGRPLIPIGSHVFDATGCTSFDKYLMDFLAIDWERDGKTYDRYTDPEYISWLKMFRQLGEEGYLSNEIFTDTRTQMEEKLEQGQYFCMIYQYTDLKDQQKALYANDQDSIYMAVEGPRNSAGDDPKLPVSSVSGWTVTFISKNCKDPERAIAFMDYLLSEHGQKIIYLGVEGETYAEKDGVPVLYDDVRQLLDTDRTAYDKKYGADDAYWMLQNNIMQQQWNQDSSPAMAQIEDWATKYTVYAGEYDYSFPVESQEADIAANAWVLWGDTLPMLLMANSEEEFDRIFEDYLNERDALGYDELLDAETDYTIRAKEKLGIVGENGEYTYTE